MKTNIEIYSTYKIPNKKYKCKKYITIKVSRNWLEKITDDGLYRDEPNIKNAICLINELKKQFPNYKIIDKENLLKRYSK